MVPGPEPHQAARSQEAFGRVLTAAGLILAAAAVLRLGAEYRAAVDLHFEDEADALRRAFALLDGDPGALSIAWWPLYVLLYVPVIALSGDWIVPSDLMFLLVVGGTTLAAVWAFSAGRSSVPPLLFGVLVLANPIVLNADRVGFVHRLHLYTLQLLPWFLALGWAARGRAWYALLPAASVFFLRSEAALWLLATGCILFVLGRRRHATLAAAFVVLGSAGTALNLLHPETKSRALLALQQHFALGSWERADEPEPQPPFDEFEPIWRASFGNATGLVEAVRANPTALAGHVAWNARRLPEKLRATLVSPFPRSPWTRGALFGLLAVCLAAGFRARTTIRWRHEDAPALALMLGTLACFVPALIVRSKPGLLLPLLPSFLAGIHLLARRTVADRPATGLLRRTLPLPFFALLAAGPSPYRGPEARRAVDTPIRTAVTLARHIPPDSHLTFLTDHAAAVRNLARRRTLLPLDPLPPGRRPSDAETGFLQALREERPEIALLYRKPEVLAERIESLRSLLPCYDVENLEGPWWLWLHESADLGWRVLLPPRTRIDFEGAAPWSAVCRIGGVRRIVLACQAPCRVSFPLETGGDAAFHTWVAKPEELWMKKTDGVLVRVTWRTARSRRVLTELLLDPQRRPEQRRWLDLRVALPRGRGTLVLETLPGRAQDASNAYDLVVWARPRVRGAH